MPAPGTSCTSCRPCTCLFHGDRTLLQIFLETYGPGSDWTSDFPHRAMCYTLLAEFCLSPLFQDRPELTALRTLEGVAEVVWEKTGTRSTRRDREGKAGVNVREYVRVWIVSLIEVGGRKQEQE